ncbi:MAG: MFS transporter [Bacilli bacterium]|nr:MFS transporter [Bacilli bacterium]
MKKRKLSIKDWFFIWGLGIAGQLCWNLENVWFNSFVYDRITPDHSIITWMVAISATVTTIATFLMGALSDRMGKRRPFIGWGYIAWGLFTIVFGLTQYLHSSFVAIVVVVVAADSIMSFFGSTGNDAGFNAWTTDLLDDNNRGQIGAAIAIHPVLGTIIGTVLGGLIISVWGYLAFFIIMGILVIVMGVLSLLFLNEEEKPKQTDKSFFKQFTSAFNFKDVFKMKELLLVYITTAIFFIGFNVFFVHITNYFIYALNYDEGFAGIILGGSLLVSVVATVPAAKLINRNRNFLLLTTSILIYIVGLLVIYFFGEATTGFLVAGVILAGMGYVVQMQTLTVWGKRLYPEGNRGQFEGVRIVFSVLLPMVFGPMIADPLIDRYGIPIVVDGKEGLAPSNVLFLAAIVFAVLSFIPLFYANRVQRKENFADGNN